MISGKTKTGFEFKVDPRIGNDWRILSDIARVEGDDVMDQVKATTELVSLILGENEKKLMEHIANTNDGYIPMKALINELADIIASTKELKN